MNRSGTPFYLTGGTALSRGYFNHRYSDDPDLFVNQDENYSLYDKLSAVFRYEAKDIADIWVIAKHKMLAWTDIIHETKTKEGGTDPIVIFNILKSFPEHLLPTIKWIISVDPVTFKKELDRIADDILEGKENGLIGT